MIASTNNNDSTSLIITDTISSSCTESYTPTYIPVKEEEVEEIIPEKATIFKANNRNIIRQNKFSFKQQFRNHRVRNR